MLHRPPLLTLWLALAAASCVPPGARSAPPLDERREAGRELETFRQLWLGPARVAPPAVPLAPHEAEAAGLTGTATPLRAEDAPWNEWPGEGFRLFNNRAGLFFEVAVQGEGPLRWLPDATLLELNGGRVRLPPARSPEELLHPLLQAALVQEQWALDGDLVQRTRAAGAFRQVYLPLAVEQGELGGVLAFPMPQPDLQVVDLRLTVGVHDGTRRQVLVWTWE